MTNAVTPARQPPSFFRVLLSLAATIVVLAGMLLGAPVVTPTLFALVLSLIFSPLYSWLLGLGLALVKPSIRWEFPLVHLINFLIYVGALGCFAFFWRQLGAYRRTMRSTERGDRADAPVATRTPAQRPLRSCSTRSSPRCRDRA